MENEYMNQKKWIPNDTDFYRRCIIERLDENRLTVLKYQKDLYGRKLSPIIHTFLKRYYDHWTQSFKVIQESVETKDTEYEHLTLIDNRLVRNRRILSVDDFLRYRN